MTLSLHFPHPIIINSYRSCLKIPSTSPCPHSALSWCKLPPSSLAYIVARSPDVLPAHILSCLHSVLSRTARKSFIHINRIISLFCSNLSPSPDTQCFPRSLSIKTEVLKMALRPCMSSLPITSLTSSPLTPSLACSIPVTLSSLLFQARSCLEHTCPDSRGSLCHLLQSPSQIHLNGVAFPDSNSCSPTPTLLVPLSTYHYRAHPIFNYLFVYCFPHSHQNVRRAETLFILCPEDIEQCQAYSRCSGNNCRMNERMNS